MSLVSFSPERAALVAQQFVDEFEAAGRAPTGKKMVCHTIHETELLPASGEVIPAHRSKVEISLSRFTAEYLTEWINSRVTEYKQLSAEDRAKFAIWRDVIVTVSRDLRETSIVVTVAMQR